MADQPLGFNAYARKYYGMSGQMPDTKENRRRLDYLKNKHAAYLEGFEGGNFQPSIVTVTNPTTQAVEQAFMSSPNSATLMRDAQPRVQYKPDKEGNLLAIEGSLANYVTNNTGERIKVDPKSNRLEDLMAIMGGGGAAAPVEEEQGFLSRIFGGVPATNAPAATPTPTPMATPTPTPMATPTPTPAMTNAAVPVAAPGPMTPDQVRAAYRQGAISKEQARALLQGGL